MEAKKDILGRVSSHARGIQIFLLMIAGLFALYSFIGFFILPPILKSVLVKEIQAKTRRQTEIADISTNPYWLTADIKGLMVRDKDGTPFLSFDELFADYQIISVFKQGSVIREVRLAGPYLKVIREKNLSYNLSELLKSEKPRKEKKPTYYSVNNIQIYGGRVDFHDLPKNALHRLTDINLTVPFISDLDYYIESFVEPSFSAKLDGRAVSFKGRTKPFAESRQTDFNIHIGDLDLTKYIEYLPEAYRVNLKSGIFNADGRLSFIETKARGGNMVPSLKLAGLFRLSDFRLDGNDGSRIIEMPSLRMSLKEAELYSRRATINSLEIQDPDLSVLRDKEGKFNFARLLPPGKETASPQAAMKPEQPGRLSMRVASVKLTGGKLQFIDEKNSLPFKTALSPVDFEAKDLVYDQRKPVNPESAFSLSASSEAGETINVRGRVSLKPVKAEGAFSVQDMPVERYQPYLADSFNVGVTKGTLAISSDFGYSSSGFMLSGLSMDLRSLVLRNTGESRDFLTVPSLLVSGTDADFKNKTITVGSAETKRGRIEYLRDSSGKVNLAGLIKPAGKPEGGKAAGPEGQPWKLTVKNFALSSYDVDYADYKAESPVEMSTEDVRLSVKDFSLSPGSRSPISLSFRQKGAGEFRASGTASMAPVKADLDVNSNDIDVIPFQPYFTQNLNINVISGVVSVNGHLGFSYSKENGLVYRYSGEASVNEFASADKEEGEEFLNWNTLYFGGMEASSSPFSLDIKQVALTDFFSKLIIYPDGSLNVQGVVKKTPEGQAKAEAAPIQPAPGGQAQARKDAEAASVKVERVTLQGGHINFTDNHIKPSYSAELTDIGGRISGLSSSEQAAADVDLRGRINDYAPIEITGKMNPLRRDLYVDLKLGMEDMDLSQLTPYSRRYVGYSIAKGKLAMNLQYLIVRRALNSQNKLLFDQLTLGQRTESPDAIRLPVKLAISLLKNRQGQINLEFPVTGNLSDPKFDFGNIVLRVITNTLKKIVSSPFALLGRLFGGGEELGYVEFDYGSHSLGPAGEKKVAVLNKALYNRPELELEVAGYVDPEKDKNALRSYKFFRKLKEAKYSDMAKGERPADIDQVQIKPDEYEKYLKKAYKAEKFPKPKNVLGLEKSLPVPEMEKLIIAHIEVTEEDLAKLARERAASVKQALLAPGNVDPKRVFLLSPGTIAPEEKKNLRESRVEFGLK